MTKKDELNIPKALLDILKNINATDIEVPVTEKVETSPEVGKHIKLNINDDTSIKEKFGR
jgi:hypothetical protein